MSEADGTVEPGRHGESAAEPSPPGQTRAESPPTQSRASLPGRGRELVGRRRQRKAADTGRVHHLGAAPAVMPVLHGDQVDTSTRTAAVQLAARTRWELERLAEDLTAQMAAAAAALDFERAGPLRDELARVRAELDRRAGR